MHGNCTLELHSAECPSDDVVGLAQLFRQGAADSRDDGPFAIADGDGTVWAGIDPATNRLERRERRQDASFGFRTVRRRVATDLAVVARSVPPLVNGVPALALSVVGPKDSLTLAPGAMFYVTARVRPHVGRPTAELVGAKCPFCRIEVRPDTHVVACRCGAVYHHETAQSHPETPAQDRLDCFGKVKACLACGHELVLDEYLVWDPNTF